MLEKSVVTGETSGRSGVPLPATAPFEEALRTAIRARGLSLERIHERLRLMGAQVSPATLSYWQSGRTRPERARSLVALGHLETILDLPKGELANRLGPPRPRGRWVHKAGGELDIGALWTQPGQVTEVRRQINTQWDGWLTRLSQHDLFEIGPDGTESSLLTRQVLRAEDEGPDRWACVYQMDEPGPPPILTTTPPCRAGQRFSSPDNGFVAFEVLFDRALAKDETIICEYRLTHQEPRATARGYERKFRFPVREYVLEVCFDPAAVPASVHQYEAMSVADTERGEELTVDAGNRVHAVALGFGPGRFGIRWDW